MPADSESEIQLEIGHVLLMDIVGYSKLLITEQRQRLHGLYSARRFVIECPAPSTTIFLATKNSIIFISALSLAAMMLTSCGSIPSAYNPFGDTDFGGGDLAPVQKATPFDPSDPPVPGETIKSHP